MPSKAILNEDIRQSLLDREDIMFRIATNLRVSPYTILNQVKDRSQKLTQPQYLTEIKVQLGLPHDLDIHTIIWKEETHLHE